MRIEQMKQNLKLKYLCFLYNPLENTTYLHNRCYSNKNINKSIICIHKQKINLAKVMRENNKVKNSR